MTVWLAVAFVTGISVGALATVILSRQTEHSWKIAYLNLRDHVWRLEREQEGA